MQRCSPEALANHCVTARKVLHLVRGSHTSGAKVWSFAPRERVKTLDLPRLLGGRQRNTRRVYVRRLRSSRLSAHRAQNQSARSISANRLQNAFQDVKERTRGFESARRTPRPVRTRCPAASAAYDDNTGAGPISTKILYG